MKVKTSDLTGPLLNWAAAKAMASQGPGWQVSIYGVASVRLQAPTGGVIAPFMPGHDWNHCGWLIEETEIGVRRNAPSSAGREWEATPSITAKGAGGKWGYGPTPQIAVTRCFVASILGDEVDIPGELIFT